MTRHPYSLDPDVDRAYYDGWDDGRGDTLSRLRTMIISELEKPQHLTGVLRPGLRKALSLVETLDRAGS